MNYQIWSWKNQEREENGLRCLTKAINGLFELPHMMWILEMEKSRWLLYKDIIRQCALKKSIVNIELP